LVLGEPTAELCCCVIRKLRVAFPLEIMKISNRDERVYQYLRDQASAGTPGTRLSSVREVTRTLHVSPVTVRTAVDRLEREGLLEARPGLGTFAVGARKESGDALADMGWQSLALGPSRVAVDSLAALETMPSGRTRALNFGYLPDGLQATSLLAAAAARALRRPGVWSRMPVEGVEALRVWFADEAGGTYLPAAVTICPGTQAALAATFRALAVPGEPVLVESPTYGGAMAAARAAGLKPVPVPTDMEGVCPDLLEEAFHRTGAKLFYCQPTYANPTGTVLSASRRREVLDIVTKAGAFLIEDDWARDFHLEGGMPLGPLASEDRGGHVIYVRSLTKCAAPSLRIGAICARGAALVRLRAARLLDDFFVPGIMQETALQLVTASTWPRHMRNLRTSLRHRRDALALAVRTHLGPESLPHIPKGGLHLWVSLPQGTSDQDVAAAAAREGVLVSAGHHWFPAEPPSPWLRLSFAPADPEWVDEAIARLASALRQGRNISGSELPSLSSSSTASHGARW